MKREVQGEGEQEGKVWCSWFVQSACAAHDSSAGASEQRHGHRVCKHMVAPQCGYARARCGGLYV